MRRVLSAILGLATLGVLSGSSRAASSLTKDSFTVGLYHDAAATSMAFTDTEKSQFFNQANCQCDTPFYLKIAGATGGFPTDADNQSVEVWVGTGCDVPTTRTTANCTMLDANFQVSSLHTMNKIVTGHPQIVAGGDCTTQFKGTKTLYILVDGDSNGTYMDAGDVNITLALDVDTKPPSTPTSGSITSGNGQLHVTFSGAVAGEGVQGFQLLCDPAPKSASTALFNVCSSNPALDVSKLCGGSSSASATSLATDQTLTNGTAYTVSVVSFDEHKNPSLPYVVGTATPEPSEDFFTHYRKAGGLEDGGYCFVATAAWGDYNHPAVRVLRDFRDQILGRTLPGRLLIRAYYWASPPFAAFIRLSPVLRFAARLVLWPLVIAAGLVTYASPLGRVLLLAALLLGLLLRRRLRRGAPRPRRRLRLARALPALGFLVVLAAVSPAFADDAPAPAPAPSDEPPAATPAPAPDAPPGEQPATAPADKPLPPPAYLPPESVIEDRSDFYGQPPRPPHGGWARGRYVLEIKLGPYHPNVDSEPGITGHPYDDIFGSGPTIRSDFEVGIALYRGPLGWLGLSGSIGYLSDSAKALAGTAGGTTGDSTSFSMVPMALSGVWRIDQLAERYNIPIVPYAKLGLGSSFWWSKNGAGNDSSFTDPTSGKTGHARGSVFGYQAELGAQILLDGLDASTARSLSADLGIQHLYAFVELLYAKLDNFGAKDRIHLGDTTWLAGIAFEM